MSCYHPIKAIRYKNRTHETSIYSSARQDYKTVLRHDVRILKREEYDQYSDNDEIEVLNLSCGQCRGCRMDYAHNWANRLMLELEMHKDDLDSCHFITLTIDDDNIDSDGTGERPDGIKPLEVLHAFSCDPDTGIVTGYCHSLCVDDLQRFLKRLRGDHPEDCIRFFACGEYGDKSFRPHYHLIVFGLHLPDGDLEFYKKSGLGYDYMTSKELSKTWPFGYNVVAPVTWESCCYVARYMVKKIKGEGAALYDKYNLKEPFVTMSRRPGIASEYYETHGLDPKRMYYYAGSADGSRQFAVPRYIEKAFEFDDPEAAKERSERRKLSAISRSNLVSRKTDIDPERYLELKEKKILKSLKYLDSFRSLD